MGSLKYDTYLNESELKPLFCIKYEGLSLTAYSILNSKEQPRFVEKNYS